MACSEFGYRPEDYQIYNNTAFSYIIEYEFDNGNRDCSYHHTDIWAITISMIAILGMYIFIQNLTK